MKRFDSPDEVRTFPKGRFETVQFPGVIIGRATYEPGWKWSEHVDPSAGAASCQVEHAGMVVSGRAAASMDDGRRATIVGWWARRPTSLCTSWGPRSTRAEGG